ncbi:hypothetical protein M0812_16732 [Anaeramoeba flamelloides]|uniref:Uncharacterized protein n=1 Tax=Anaeramoeba flamelloides TaxID=1746091 RepID=A0AAV7ZBJ7_9EUKA|nr:hypothetical protein M0812_16732 [Anaeramoeba flamelloides]
MGNTEHTPNVCEEKNELYQKLFKSNKACAVFNNYEQIVFFTKRFLKNIGWSGSGFVIKNQTIDFFSTPEQPGFQMGLIQAKTEIQKLLKTTKKQASFKWQVFTADRKNLKVLNVSTKTQTVFGEVFLQVHIKNSSKAQKNKMNNKPSKQNSEKIHNQKKTTPTQEKTNVPSKPPQENTKPIKSSILSSPTEEYNQNIINAFNRIKRQLGRVDDDELKIDINLNMEKIQKILEHYQKKKQKSFSSCVKHMRESQKCYQKKYQRLQSHHNSRLIEIDNNKELKLKLIRENKVMRQRISQTFQFLLSQKNGIKNILSQVEPKNFSDLSNQNDYY